MSPGLTISVGRADRPAIPPYRAGRIEGALDRMIGVVAPGLASRRLQSRLDLHRAQHQLRYQSAYPTDLRSNANPNTASAETQVGNRERLALEWNAIEVMENSPIFSGMINKIVTYLVGTLQYQPRSGSKEWNKLAGEYLKDRLGKICDLAGRKTFRVQTGLAVKGGLVKGDCGLNIVRSRNVTQLQGIEGDRIGHPYQYRATAEFIGGVHLDEYGAHLAYDIYTKSRKSGMYHYQVTEPANSSRDWELEKTIPAFDGAGLPQFLLYVANPRTFDDIRGRSIFGPMLNKADIVDKITKWELEALAWASSQSGVYHTDNGEIPRGMQLSPMMSGQPVGTIQSTKAVLQPNTIQALGPAERIEMFEHERPSPNTMTLLFATIREIGIGAGFSYPFVYDCAGLSGPAYRGASSQDERTLRGMKENARDEFMDPIVWLVLAQGIANGEIPYHPNWRNGLWIFPAHPTIDGGRDSASNIAEYARGLTTGSIIASESGHDFAAIQEECALEAEQKIELAMQVAERLTKKTGKEIDWETVLGVLSNGDASETLEELGAAEQKSRQGALYTAQAVQTSKDAIGGKADDGRTGATDDPVAIG